VDVTANFLHAAEFSRGCKAASDPADTLRGLFHKKSSNHIRNKCEEYFPSEHVRDDGAVQAICKDGKMRLRSQRHTGGLLGGSTIYQIPLVRLLCGPMIESQIIPAGRLQPFMPQNLLDVTHRASVEKKLGGGGVPQQMRRHWFVDARELSVAQKRPPDVLSLQACVPVEADKQSPVTVLAGLEIPL
jgi:hypothetical protein